MAEIVPIYQRRQLPPAMVGAAKPPYELADRSGERRFGETLAAFSGDIFEKLLQVRVNNEIASYNGNVEAEQERFRTRLKENPVASIDEIRQWRDETISNIEKYGQQLTLPASQNFAKNWMAENKNLLTEKINGDIAIIDSIHQKEKTDLLLENFINQRDEKGALDLIDSQTGNLYYADIAPLVKEQVSAKIQALKQKDNKAAAQSEIYAEALSMGKDGQRWLEDPDAQKWFMKKYGLDPSEINQIVNINKGRLNEQLKIQNDEANKQLTDLMLKGQLTIDNVEDRRTNLDAGDYESWAKIAMNPPDKKGNEIEAAELEGDSIDIWRGAITYDDFDKKIRNSLADPQGINRQQASRIIAAASTELKRSQAELLNDARTEARDVLVDYASESSFDEFIKQATQGMKPDIKTLFENKAIEKRKFQLDYLARYESELRDWLSQPENKNKNRKEIYQYSDALKHAYWNSEVENLRRLEEKKEPTIEKPRAKTIKIVMPDGRIWNVAEDKLDIAIKRGGKKL